MSVLSSIDTSLFTTPYYAAQETDPFQPIKAIDYAKEETPNIAAEDTETPQVDLNNYYANVQPDEYNQNNGSSSDVWANLALAEQNFGDAVMEAVAKGMTPQTAVNLQMAKVAYTASMRVAAVEKSTFEFMV